MSKSNQYFNLYSKTSTVESEVLRQQCDELTNIFGVDVLYIPRTQENLNKFLGEDQSTKFTTAYEMVFLTEGLENWNSGQDIFSKFGMMSNFNIKCYIEKARFVEETENVLISPRVGDLIYISILDKFFEISYQNDRPIFYHLGQTYAFEMEIIQFRYSHEEISTGVDIVDDNVPTEDFSNDVDNDIVDDLNISEAVFKDYDEEPTEE